MGRLFLAVLLACSSVPAHADDPFIGRWSSDPSRCWTAGATAATAPLILTDHTVSWQAFSCTIKKSYRIGEGLYLQARCQTDGKARVMPIGLQLKGPGRIAVTWDQTAAGEMQRCR